MEENFVNTVVLLHKNNKWKEILKMNPDSKFEFARKLLWVWPSEENLYFIKKTLAVNGCTGIISVGCGCGLFEWILHASTGM